MTSDIVTGLAPDEAPAPSWWAKSLLLALAVAYVLPYALTIFTPDTARDLDAAYRIVTGAALPTRGPIIASTLHLGPIWYYVLAAGMGALGSLTGVSLYVGTLAALKYALAYLTARELGGARYGFYTAIAVSLPGPALLQSITWTHPNLVEAASWLVLLACCRAWRRESDGWFIVAGLALGLALHTHPTTVLLAPVVAAMVVQRFRAGTSPTIGVMIAMLAATALPLVPGAFEPASRVAEAASLSAAIEGAAQGVRAADLLQIPYNMFVGIPDRVAGTFLYRGGIAGPVWHVVVGFVGFALAVGALLLTRYPMRRLGVIALVALAAFALGVGAIASLRAFTPYYMTFVLLPGVALAAGAALTALVERGGPWRALGLAATAAIASIQFALAGGMINRGSEGWLTTSLFTVSDFKADASASVITEQPLYPVWTRDAIGRALCAGKQHVALHGMLATGFDSAFALETKLRCGAEDLVALEGQAPGVQHWVGLPVAVWRRLGVDPTWSVGTYGLAVPARVLAPELGHPIASDEHYPPRIDQRGTSRALPLRFRAPSNATLVVTNPIPWYMALDAAVVTIDGRALTPLAASSGLLAFRCRDCDAHDVEWTLELRATDPTWIDVVLL